MAAAIAATVTAAVAATVAAAAVATRAARDHEVRAVRSEGSARGEGSEGEGAENVKAELTQTGLCRLLRFRASTGKVNRNGILPESFYS